MIRNKLQLDKQFSRRAFLYGGIQGLMFGGLAARLYYLQMMQAENFQTLAEGNRMRLFPVLPSRGRLLDRSGHMLAEGFLRYQAFYDPPGHDLTQPIINIVETLQQILHLDDEAVKNILEKIQNASSKEKILIDDYLNWEEVAALEVQRPQLPGIELKRPEMRTYPYGAITSHVVGYIGAPSKKDLENNPGLSNLAGDPEFKVGKSGLELMLEDRLRGKAGVRQAEVDARGRFIRDLNIDPGTAGDDITLTLDIELQRYMIEQLAGKGGLEKEGGSGVVLDVTNGDILAMTSVPTYDPNRFTRGIDSDYWTFLNNNKDKPLINKAISSQYPPGSTFKPIVALAALEAGIINTETSVFCPGYLDFGSRRFHCWKRGGHGHMNVVEAIAESCNVYFYEMAKRVGVDLIAKYAKKFGFGELTGIELPNEKPGILPSPEWKREALNQPWYRGETLNMAIGQGYTTSTPLQLAVCMARMASGGRNVSPRLVRSNNPDDYELVQLDTGEKILLPKDTGAFPMINEISREHLATVMYGMNLVVNDRIGSAYRHRIKRPSMAFGGKTGTAQVVNRRFKDLPANAAMRFHSLFIGYAPVVKPKYAVSVIVEHGGYGSTMAAPIARNLLYKAQQLKSGD